MNFKHVNLAIFSIGLAALAGGITFFTLTKTSTPSTNTSTTNTTANIPTVQQRTDAPLYFTTMTHMEEDWKDDTIEPLFHRHVAILRNAMNLFDTFGAKMTVESAEPFAKANTIWGVNIMKEVLDRGHGVGTHAGFHLPDGETVTIPEYAALYAEGKSYVDALVGAENNQGVSGGFAEDNWVQAAAQGGFKFLDGLTALGYLSMPMSARPEGFTDVYINMVAYHDSIPPDFADRLYLYDLKDTADLVPDNDGVLTIMGGEIGELGSIAEGRSTCNPDCVFDEADIAAVVDYIKQADTIRDRSRVARLNIHIPLTLFDEHLPLIQELLEAIKPYADNGTIVFATQLEAYQGYKNF